MVMSVQVHEKTDKRGTWAYHKFDGWYLVTSPERYRTHRCHIKSTSNKRFTETINFSHRKLTRTTITHAEKVMAEIADCAKAIRTWAMATDLKKWTSWFISQSAQSNIKNLLQQHLQQQHSIQQDRGCRWTTTTATHAIRYQWQNPLKDYQQYPHQQFWGWNSQQ